jgi:DNA-binding transcriptional ArsR family regulator
MNGSAAFSLAGPEATEGRTRPALEDTVVQDVLASAERLKALGHPVRLAILRALGERSSCCCAELCSRLPLAQSTVSQHLKVLREAGLVSFRREGVRSSYVLNPDALAAVRADMEEVAALLAALGPTTADEER